MVFAVVVEFGEDVAVLLEILNSSPRGLVALVEGCAVE